MISDPVLYYTMDSADISGTTIIDRGSGGHNATMIGSPTTGLTGQIGQAVGFSGSNYATASAPGGSGGDFTVAVWFYVSATIPLNTRILETKWNNEWKLGKSNASNTQLDFYVGGSFIAGGSYTLGAWHHLAGVYVRSTATASLYLDGSLVVSGTVGTPSVTNTLGIGGTNTGGNLFTGLIDEARIYSRALSSTELADLYAYTSASASSLLMLRRKAALR